MPRTSSPPNPPLQIYSTYSCIHIWNPVGRLRWNFFAETANVGCFSKGAPSMMFDGILNTMLCLQRFPSLVLHKEIVNYPCLPKSLDSHQTQKQKYELLDWPHVLISFKENSSTV